jgi:probable H4MPT-linked C1 transfer pathway protein
MSWLGIDIGGANLKAADGQGWAVSMPYPLWRIPEGLSDVLAALVDAAPSSDRLVVTMTGELCDCFCSKADGVRHILSAVEKAARRREVRVYLVGGRMVSIAEACERPQLAAASNWHALARFASRFATTPTGLLIDMGSTTTDIIPLVDGRVAARGRNDTERLLNNELLYRGVGRTPICAVVGSLPWRGKMCPVAAEVFSTTADVYVLTGGLKEDLQADWTADGRPLTKERSKQRLARQLCADASDLMVDDFDQIAATVSRIQRDELTQSIQSVATGMPEGPLTCILSGMGEFLTKTVAARARAGCQSISLAQKIGFLASQCAPAHALAVLAAEK